MQLYKLREVKVTSKRLNKGVKVLYLLIFKLVFLGHSTLVSKTLQ